MLTHTYARCEIALLLPLLSHLPHALTSYSRNTNEAPAERRRITSSFNVTSSTFDWLESDLFTNQGHPQVELRMSNNTVNIRTCSDSCSALLQLIQYISADGDLAPSYEQEEPDTAKTPSVSTRSNCNTIREDRRKSSFLSPAYSPLTILLLTMKTIIGREYRRWGWTLEVCWGGGG